MFPGYHKLNNRHALQSLVHDVYMPDITCAIESGETLTNMKMKVYYPAKRQSVVLPELSTTSFERSAIDGQGQKLHVDDFPTESFYIGEALGGI